MPNVNQIELRVEDRSEAVQAGSMVVELRHELGPLQA